MSTKESVCDEATLIAPGGKLVTNCDAHMILAKPHSNGVARITAALNSRNGLALTQKSASIVETFMDVTRRRCHKCCTKAIASDALSENPKAFARMFEAVVTYA